MDPFPFSNMVVNNGAWGPNRDVLKIPNGYLIVTRDFLETPTRIARRHSPLLNNAAMSPIEFIDLHGNDVRMFFHVYDTTTRRMVVGSTGKPRVVYHILLNGRASANLLHYRGVLHPTYNLMGEGRSLNMVNVDVNLLPMRIVRYCTMRLDGLQRRRGVQRDFSALPPKRELDASPGNLYRLLLNRPLNRSRATRVLGGCVRFVAS